MICNVCGLDGLHDPETCITILRGWRETRKDVLREAARIIERESELYRDGDKYQPHGVSLRKASAKIRRAIIT